ncbi:MAG: hypothetical protein AAF383_30535, partial [Cyanobacteria bacterium P01_A01_bin.83]
MFAELPPQLPAEVRTVDDVYPLDFKVPLVAGGILSSLVIAALNIAIKTEINRSMAISPAIASDTESDINNPAKLESELVSIENNSEESNSDKSNPDKSNPDKSPPESNKSIELNIDDYQKIGQEIIKGFAISERSQMIVAPSRCGKTTVMYFLLEEFFKRNPQMQCWVWQGKEIEPVHPKIKRSHHTLYQIGTKDLVPVNAVYEIYEQRQQGDKDRTLVKLVITDWQSIKDGLQASNSELFKIATTKIMTIANNGAALGVTVTADTQSANIDDWGLGSGSLRDNFDIYAVSRLEWIDGYPKGDIKALPKLINNKDILPSTKDREELIKIFEQLRTSMEAGLFNTSILLSTLGVCRLGITPDFERKYLKWGGYDYEITNNEITNNESMNQSTNNYSHNQNILPNSTEKLLSEDAQKVIKAIQYILDSTNDKHEQYTKESYIQPRVVYRHDRSLNSEQTKAAFDEIVQAQLAIKNSDGDIK